LIIITGPQSTDDEVGFLAEMAGLLGAVPTYNAAPQWGAATALYCLLDWEKCPSAVADVTTAEALLLPVHHLTV
jgi:hypothetical protein